MGAGQQINVPGALVSFLIAVNVEPQEVGVPVMNPTGGTSQGDPDAGGVPNFLKPASPPDIGNKESAGALIALLLMNMALTLA